MNRIILAFAFGALTCASSAFAQLPSTEAWWTGTAATGTSHDLLTRATVNTSGKEVKLSWYHLPLYPSTDDMVIKVEEFETRYWPTYITRTGDWNWYVAGKRADGKTVIEKWVFSAPVPSVSQAGFSLVPGTRTSVQVVYNEKATGRDTVLQMGLMADPQDDRLLVRFLDSRQLWIFDPAVPSWHIVASPTAVAGALMVPNLANAYGSLRCLRHSVEGNLYLLVPRGDFYEGLDSLMFVDSDADGNLDSWMVMTEALWGAMQLNDSSLYIYPW